MDYSVILSIIGMGSVSASVFFHTKFQAARTKEDLAAYKIDAEKDIISLQNMINEQFKKIDSHGEDIRSLQTEKVQFLTAKDADDLYLRIKEFDRFEKHIDKRFDSIESSMGKILAKLDTLKEK